MTARAVWRRFPRRSVLALLPALLVACADAADDTTPVPPPPAADTPTPAPSGATPDTPPADEQVAAPAGAGDWTAGVSDERRDVTGAATLQAIRVAGHADFDRIVLDFGAGPLPGHHVEYVDRPVRQCGSGDVVELAGDAWLSIRVEPANAHTEEGRPTVAERSRTPGLPVIRELKLTCDFEAQVEWVAGVSSPNPYRIFTLEQPARLVVDVRR
jgi:hypothetical protein